MREIAVENRAFLRRAVRYMCKSGIDQFIDIGSGLPSIDNTHEVAARLNPDAHIVYVDIDETAVAHGQEMLRGNDNAVCIRGSALNVDAILDHPETRKLINFERPVGVLILALLHFFTVEQGQEVLGKLTKSLPRGSYIGLSHAAADEHDPVALGKMMDIYAKAQIPIYVRPIREIDSIVNGFEQDNPGMVKGNEWRREEAEAGEPELPKIDSWYVGVLRV
jgi:hypothetical protein